MQITEKSKVGEIVRENFKTAVIFEQNQIDFCCGGGISLEQACTDRKLNTDALIEELNHVLNSKDPDSAYIESLTPGQLCDYIEQRHHSYVRETIPFLQAKLQKLSDVHGINHPELIVIKDLFDGAAAALTEHLKIEETVVFPAIRQFAGSPATTDTANFEDVLNSMLDDHQTEGDRFESIAALSSGYTCPPDGCNTYRVSYETLKDFERDLHRHVHLENNILFVKALALYQDLPKNN